MIQLNHTIPTHIVTYPITPAEIEAKRAEYALITFDNPTNYLVGVKAIATCRSTRVAVEERRKELKADSLAYGRAVDGAAKELTALIEELEEPLKAKRDAVDAEKHRIKLEAEAAKQAIVEAELRAKLEAEQAEKRAEEARTQAERVAERARMDAEREALAAERAALEEIQRQADVAASKELSRLLALKAEQDAAAKVERDKLEADIRAHEKERQALEHERRTRERELQAAKEAEEQQIAELERRAEAERRLAALQPDIVKLKAFAATIRALERPAMGPEAVARLTHVNALLDRAARLLESDL